SFSGAAFSLRAGTDFRIGSLGFVSPYAGYMTMFGHDGPEFVVRPDSTSPYQVAPTRPSSFQLGVALTPRLYSEAQGHAPGVSPGVASAPAIRSNRSTSVTEAPWRKCSVAWSPETVSVSDGTVPAPLEV